MNINWRKKLKMTVASLALLGVAACGGGGSVGNGNGTPKYTGKLIDSTVSNIKYETATRTGVTASDGSFGYDTLDGVVSFKIGTLVIGSAIASPNVHIYDLNTAKADIAGLNATRVAQLLQSLDTDGNATNGIQISDVAHTVLSQPSALSFSSTTFDADLQNLLVKTGGRFVTASQALAHADQTYAATPCVIAPTTYPLPDRQPTIDTTNSTCARRAQLAVYFDVVAPKLDSNASLYLANDMLVTSVGIVDTSKKEFMEKSVIKAFLDNTIASINDTVDLVTADPKDTNLVVAQSMKLGADAVSKSLTVICAVQGTQCSPDRRNEVEFITHVLESAGSTAPCLQKQWTSCAEALKTFVDIKQLYSYLISPDAARAQVAALATVIVDVFKLYDTGSNAMESKDPAAKLLFAAAGIRASLDTYVVAYPDAATGNRTVLDNTIQTLGASAESLASCAAVMAAKTFEQGLKSAAACTDKAANTIFDQLTTILLDVAFIHVANNMIVTGNSYQVANVAIREILTFNTLDEASLYYAPGYQNGRFNQSLQESDTNGAKLYFRDFINNIVGKWFPSIKAVNGSYNGIDYDQIRQIIASEFKFIVYRTPKLMNGTVGTCATLKQGAMLFNNTPVSSLQMLALNTSFVAETSFAGTAGIRKYLINWGDGVIEESTTPTGTHSYPTSGVYRVSIRPTINSLSGGAKVCPSHMPVMVGVALPPVVTNVSPAIATLNTPTTFTVTGTNLPPTVAFAMQDATCQSPITRITGGFTVSCTPTLTGSKGITITMGSTIDTTRTVNVSAAAVAVTSSCGAPVTKVLFAEDFLAPLSPTKWTVDTTGGTVTSGGGLVAVAGGATSRFPYIQSVSNPFPATGNFSFYCKGKYTHVGSSGTGVCAASEIVIPVGSVWWTFNGGSTLGLWSAFGSGNAALVSVNIGTAAYSSPIPDNAVHEFESCVVGSTVTTYVDGVQVRTATLPATWNRPKYIWFGNSVLGGTDWSSFETNKIEVRQLR